MPSSAVFFAQKQFAGFEAAPQTSTRLHRPPSPKRKCSNISIRTHSALFAAHMTTRANARFPLRTYPKSRHSAQEGGSEKKLIFLPAILNLPATSACGPSAPHLNASLPPSPPLLFSSSASASTGIRSRQDKGLALRCTVLARQFRSFRALPQRGVRHIKGRHCRPPRPSPCVPRLPFSSDCLPTGLKREDEVAMCEKKFPNVSYRLAAVLFEGEIFVCNSLRLQLPRTGKGGGEATFRKTDALS